MGPRENGIRLGARGASQQAVRVSRDGLLPGHNGRRLAEAVLGAGPFDRSRTVSGFKVANQQLGIGVRSTCQAPRAAAAESRSRLPHAGQAGAGVNERPRPSNLLGPRDLCRDYAQVSRRSLATQRLDLSRLSPAGFPEVLHTLPRAFKIYFEVSR